MSPNLKCRLIYLVIFWALFGLWAFHSYFLGENSLLTLSELRQTYQALEREKNYWKTRNEVLRERLSSLEESRDYYYEKLGRELFVRGKEGERVILFVK